MSNDEPAWYETEATARVEPEHLGRLASDGVQFAQPVTPAFRIGTVATEDVPVEPFRPAHVSEPLLQGRLTEPELFEQPRTAAHRSEPLHGTSAALPEQQARPRTDSEAAKRRVADDGGGGGSAGQGFKVDPEQYRAAVSPMLAASEQVASLYRSLNAYLPSLEAQNPWGNDDSGKKFAEGDLGYLKCSHGTMALLKSLPEGLKGIAEGLKRMAESYQNADENTVAELSGIESTAQMPVAPSLPAAPVHLPITPGMTQSGRH